MRPRIRSIRDVCESSSKHASISASSTHSPGRPCGRRRRWRGRCPAAGASRRTRGCWPPTPPADDGPKLPLNVPAAPSFAGAGHDGGVQVQDGPAGRLAPAHRNCRGNPPGRSGRQRPHHAPDRGTGGALRLLPCPERRSPPACAAGWCPRQDAGTTAASGAGTARFKDVGGPERDRAGRLDQCRAPLPPPRPAALRQRGGQGPAQPAPVGDFPRQHGPRVRDQVLLIGPHHGPTIPTGGSHPEGASPQNDGLDLERPDHRRWEAPFCCQGVSARL